MTNDTGAGPYYQAASLYRSAGWEGVLPLPPGLKHPPPAGWTGWGGPMPSGADVQAWLDGPEAAGNIALRPPRGVLGIDADTYKPAGAATMRELESRLGPLPATWISSARTDGSGIRWYRVPADIPGWHSKAGEGVELVHFGHRYAVVFPSTNPDAGGAGYDWWWLDPVAGLIAPEELVGWNGYLPSPDRFPDLPDAWIEALRGPAPGAKAHLADGEALRWLEAVRDGEACPPVGGVLQRAREAFASQASRYDTMRDSMRALTGFGAEGHAGTVPALAALRDAYLAATAGERRDTVGEWARALEGAIALEADARPGGPERLCTCAGTPGTIDLDFLHAPPVAESADGAEQSPPEAIPALLDLPDHLAAQGDVKKEARRITRAILEHGGYPAEEIQEYRDALLAGAGLLKGDFEAIAKAIKAEEKERRRAEAKARRAEAQEKGELLAAPYRPMEVARQLMERLSLPLTWWRGDFYLHTGAHWRRTEDADIEQAVYLATEHARYDEGEKVEDWSPDKGKVAKLLDALGKGVLNRGSTAEDEKVIATTNGVLDVPTRTLAPHDPARFNLASLPYAYDPAATAPQWEAFLASSLPGDQQAIDFLQEWFGYVISGRTDQQKIACLVGKRRGGKGTVGRVMMALAGRENCAGGTLNSLAGEFGLAPMIGKSLAVLPDVTWKARHAVEAVEILKMVSGEDSPPVNRKNQAQWDGKLGVRFLIMTNDVPTFSDSSGALEGRLICVRFRESFFGREDVTLTDRLLTELPGILNWALAGLDRLNARGRFVEPASSDGLKEEIKRGSEKLYGFLEDDCVRSDAAADVELHDLYQAYLAWCEDELRDHAVPLNNFTKELTNSGVEWVRSTKARAVPVPGRPVRPTWVKGLAPRNTAGWRSPRWVGAAAQATRGTPGHFG